MARELLASISIALLPTFVNGTESSKPKSSPAVSPAATFQFQIQETLNNGKAKVFDGITRFPEIQKASPTRRRTIFETETLDAHRRSFSVVLDQSTSAVKPIFIELFVEEKDRPASISNQHFFLLGLDGTLKKSGMALGQLDEKGRSTSRPALAPFKYFDNDSPETRARLKRELDFWLKGIGRKPSASPAGEGNP